MKEFKDAVQTRKRSHRVLIAPEGVVSMVDNIIANMLFFDTVGLMGACGVK